MSDSVGKISLDLEVKSDIGKQISNVSNVIGNSLKSSLNNSTSQMFNSMRASTSKGMKAFDTTIKNSINKTFSNVKKTMKSLLTSFNNMKPISFPTVKVQKPTMTTTSPTQRRGPPIDKNAISAQIDNVASTLDNTNARIEQQKIKLAQLKEEYDNAFSTNRKNALQEKILKTEASINRLIATSDKLGFKLADLDSKMNQTSGATGSVGNATKLLDKKVKVASASTKGFGSSIGMVAKQFFTWMVILPIIMKGITAMATGLYNNLMTNEQFATSLAQIKSNLLVAFTPIYYAILPAINALMSALSVATQYIASFISAIFGKTFNDSKKATQGLIDAKTAMGAYGDSAKSAGKAAKDALGLASFDEINTLAKPAEAGAGGGGAGGGEAPTLVTPELDTNTIDTKMKALTDRIKGFFKSIDYTPLKSSFEKLKNSIAPIMENLGLILKWFMDNILKPLTTWAIEDAIPAFFNLLSGALNFLNPILEVFMGVGAWLWDSFLQPIASWTGGVIVSILNGLADVLTTIGKWISEHKPIVEDFVLILGSFALAWGIVTGAMKAWAIVSGIVTTVSGGLAAAIAAIEWPIVIVIAAIGAVIAIGVLLYKHWDDIKAKAKEVWDNVKIKFSEFKDWLGNVFSTDWSKKFGAFGDILNGFLANVKNIWGSIKQVFSGVIDFVAGVFTGDWERAWQGAVDIFGGIFGGIANVAKAPLNGAIALINSAITGLNKISVDIPSWVPGMGGKQFGVNIPKIPYLAKGGIINSPTLAMVGEAGKEAVMPLENNTGWITQLADKIASKISGVGGNTNNGDVTVQLIVDSNKVGDVIIKNLQKVNRRNGKVVFNV